MRTKYKYTYKSYVTYIFFFLNSETSDVVKQSAALCLLRLFRTTQEVIPGIYNIMFSNLKLALHITKYKHLGSIYHCIVYTKLHFMFMLFN